MPLPSRDRKGVDIGNELAKEIESLPDALYQNFSSITRCLLAEAIAARKNSGCLKPKIVEHAFSSWSKSELIEHLHNLVSFLMRMNSQEIDAEEAARVALHFVHSLINKDEVQNEDIVLLSNFLRLSREQTNKLTRVRNYAYETPETP